MALNDQVSFTWVGHGTWKARSARGKEILLDPWVMNNPVAPEHLKKIDRCDLMLVSHGHFDHIYDALEIGKRTTPTLVAIPETAGWLGSKGFPGAGDMDPVQEIAERRRELTGLMVWRLIGHGLDLQLRWPRPATMPARRHDDCTAARRTT